MIYVDSLRLRTVILYSYTEGLGTAGYDEKNDAMRSTVKADSSVRFYESFTIEVQDLVRNTATLYLLLFAQSIGQLQTADEY